MAGIDTSRRRRILLLILIILIILALCFVIYYFYFSKTVSQVTNQNNPVNTNATQNININGLPTVIANVNLTPAEQQVQANKNEVLFFAMPFAERFGTFSNQSGFNNFEELKTLMTASMSNWVQTTYIPKLTKSYPAATYYGIETKALSNTFNSLDENQGKAEVLVKTQRSEFKGSLSNPRVFYQNILLQLVKSGSTWQVDGAYWQ